MRFTIVRLVGLLLWLPVGACMAAPGDIDVRFGVGGEVLRPYGASTALTAIGQGGLLLYDTQLKTAGALLIRAQLLDASGHASVSAVPGGTAWGAGGEVQIPLDSIVTPQSTWLEASVSLTGNPNGTATGLLTLIGSSAWVSRVVRIGADGKLDTAFNQATPASLSFSVHEDYAFPAPPWVQVDGSVLIRMGCNTCDGYPTPSAVLALREDGNIAQRYSLLQPALVSPFVLTVAARRLANGRVVVAGNSGLLRFNPDGALDATFGTVGVVDARAEFIRSAVEREFRDDFGYQLVTDYLEIRDASISGDGMIVVLMETAVGGESNGYFSISFLIRLDTAGRMDLSFGAPGTGIAASDWVARSMATGDHARGGVIVSAPNGRLTAAFDVDTLFFGNRRTMLWRFDGDGHPLSGAGLPTLQFVPSTVGHFAAGGGILGHPQTGAVSLMTDRSVIRLSDDSPASPGILSIGDWNVDEDRLAGTETVQVPVTRMAGSSGRVTLQYATSAASPGVPATAGQDYIATSGQLEWSDGETGTRFIALQVINDTLTEREVENIQINLAGTSGGVLRAADAFFVSIAASDVIAPEPAPPASTVPTTSPPVAGPPAAGSGGGGRFDGWMLLMLGLFAALRRPVLRQSTAQRQHQKSGQ